LPLSTLLRLPARGNTSRVLCFFGPSLRLFCKALRFLLLSVRWRITSRPVCFPFCIEGLHLRRRQFENRREFDVSIHSKDPRYFSVLCDNCWVHMVVRRKIA